MCFHDAKVFSKYNLDSMYETTGYEYDILLKVHSLEKGFAMPELRPFGFKKAGELVDILMFAKKNGFKSFSVNLGESILFNWVNLFDEMKWKKDDFDYIKAKEFVSKYVEAPIYEAGCMHKNYVECTDFNYEEFLHARHTFRDYEERILSDEDVEFCVTQALNVPSACNRQMCKIYDISAAQSKKTLLDIGLGISGISVDNAHFFLITYDMAAFSSFGERNQGYFNAGILALQFVQTLQYRGIGSCFLQFTKDVKAEEQLKNILGIPKSERIAIILSAGYIKTDNIIPASVKKPLGDMYKKI